MPKKIKYKKVVKRKTEAVKPPPKTMHAAIDREGHVRFSDESQYTVDVFIGTGPLKKFYRKAVYDLRVPKTGKKERA